MDNDQKRLLAVVRSAARLIRNQAETVQTQTARLELAQHQVMDLSALVKRYETILHELGQDQAVER